MNPSPRPAPQRRATAPIAFVVCLLTTLLGMHQATAQQRPRAQQKPNPIERILFPPELVMKHQAELALTDEQRQAVVAEIQSLQSDIVPLQFELGEETEGLGRLLRTPRVDETAALAHVEKITTLEARVKRRHFQLLIRIKNLLSPEQQQTLRRLRRGR